MSRRVLRALLAAPLLLAGCGGTARPPDLDPARVAAGIAADPSDPYWRYRQAELHFADGDAASAETELRAALAADPGHLASVSLLSRVFWDSGRHEEAVALLEAARDAGRFPPELAAALALHYDALERLDDAGEAAAAAESAADRASLGCALAFLKLRSDDYLQAEAVARRALRADPHSAANHNNFGITQLYAGKPDAAREEFLEAHRLDPKLPGACYNLAIVEHFYFFDTERARDWFRQYREMATEDPDGLAEALQRSGEDGTR
jgi:tetratricopeptide (TPR) repeat protein